MEKVICEPDFPIVETTKGKLHGYLRNEVYHFLGIEYGKAQRFQMPEMAPPWDGVRDAKSYGYVCPLMPGQEGENPIEHAFERPHRYWPMSENCLSLNIWTKRIQKSLKRPVMVWLHGGGFAEGSSIEQPSYDGYHLCDYGDVVVVTVNHRLNCIGYLDLSSYGGKYKYTGCLGMADIILALQWIRENIACFGGDADCVTIFGQSGGGSKVLTLMQMPEADGLYHRAVVQSGAFAPVPGMTREKKKRFCQELAEKTVEHLGLDKVTVAEIETVPYTVLAEACNEAAAELGRPLGLGLFEPSPIDGYYIGSYDYAGFRRESSRIPTMIGTTLGEFSFAQFLGDKEKYFKAEKVALLTGRYGANAAQIANEFQKVYPEKDILYALGVDALFRSGALSYLDARSAAGHSGLYSYIFSVTVPYMGGLTPWHCAEIPYVFRNVETEPMQCCGYQYMEKLMADVSNAWLAFAERGDPSTSELDWPAYAQPRPQMMYFDKMSRADEEKDRELVRLIAG